MATALFFSLMILLNSTLVLAEQKRVLVLNSYHEGFHWTDRIMAGVKSVFNEHGDVELFISYMDTKRRAGDEYFKQLRDLYKLKYEFVKFDAIISSDDHALDFLLKYRDELFPGTPVVFSALNDFSPSRIAGHQGYTGVYESYDVSGTIELMLKMHPKTTSISAITDGSRSGDIYKNLIEQAGEKFSNRVTINYLNNLNPEGLRRKLNNLTDNSLVLWAIYLRSPTGDIISVKDSVKLVSLASRFPTYCVWDVVGYGVVGGKITDPNYQGETAAQMASKIIEGKAPSELAVAGSPLVNIFDYGAMKRFGIDVDQVPEDSIIMNKPNRFYELYKRYVWGYTLITLLLIIIIIFLIITIVLKRKSHQYHGMAMRDQLTGLYNRHYLQEVSAQKLSLSLRYQHPLCLLMIDIDYFKDVNDTHGHIIGDKVLQKISKLLVEQSRSEDVVARFGGEEFVVLLDYCALGEAKEKAERIRKYVFALNPNGINVSVSIGVTELRAAESKLSEMLARADLAVYQAKENGRNCVVVI
ncbi:diguanylate cyclase [Dasania marina]|uniref:diguanylate cyclase n=1 Tax=Dasania marina TaxID=471499 RepID=UPI001461590B|nr:diguanylate cyclase [Dasania marina]